MDSRAAIYLSGKHSYLQLTSSHLPATESNQMLIKPSNSLQERLLLGILLLLLGQIATDGETVNHTAV